MKIVTSAMFTDDHCCFKPGSGHVHGDVSSTVKHTSAVILNKYSRNTAHTIKLMACSELLYNMLYTEFTFSVARRIAASLFLDPWFDPKLGLLSVQNFASASHFHVGSLVY